MKILQHGIALRLVAIAAAINERFDIAQLLTKILIKLIQVELISADGESTKVCTPRCNIDKASGRQTAIDNGRQLVSEFNVILGEQNYHL